jgi:hypothetical protein
MSTKNKCDVRTAAAELALAMHFCHETRRALDELVEAGPDSGPITTALEALHNAEREIVSAWSYATGRGEDSVEEMGEAYRDWLLNSMLSNDPTMRGDADDARIRAGLEFIAPPATVDDVIATLSRKMQGEDAGERGERHLVEAEARVKGGK